MTASLPLTPRSTASRISDGCCSTGACLWIGGWTLACGNQSFRTYNPAGQNARDEPTNTRIELGAKHDDRDTAAGF